MGLPWQQRRVGSKATTSKVALPWELAHAGIWQSFHGPAGASSLALIAGAYVVLGAAAVALWTGRPWYDLVVDCDVQPR